VTLSKKGEVSWKIFRKTKAMFVLVRMAVLRVARAAVVATIMTKKGKKQQQSPYSNL